MVKKLSELKTNEKAKIIRLKGGRGFKNKIESRGLRRGKEIRVITKQPGGPIVVDNGACKLTIGKGMARKILCENKR